MGEISKISWTDATFNPWWGCDEVSPACDNCYARTFSERLGFKLWGHEADRKPASEKYWNEPLKWNRKAEQSGKVTVVFCASMADIFETHTSPVVTEGRTRLFALIEQTPWLDWLLLTKRAHNMTRYAPDHWRDGWPDNVVAMVTAENQEMFDKRWPFLLQVPAARRGISVEPQVGPVDLTRGIASLPSPLHWVITGGESGHHPRPTQIEWIRNLRDQCQSAGIRFHHKQWGEWYPLASADEASQYPGARMTEDHRHVLIGKKASGRLVDGKLWAEYPARAA